MKNLEQAKTLLKEGAYTCVLCQGDAVYTSKERGVAPLLAFLESGTSFAGFSAADKVVGRATAFLYVLLGIRCLHANVLSQGAKEVLDQHQIPVAFDSLVPHIINRRGDGICPFEAAVMAIRDPEDALIAIRNKRRQIQEGK